VLRANGVEVPISCEPRVCGTCLTGVLPGEPDHRDIYLTEEARAANDQILVLLLALRLLKGGRRPTACRLKVATGQNA
jgi:ferredoxin